MNLTTASTDEPPTHTCKRILVVDDEASICNLLRRLLARLPKPPEVDIATAGSAEEARSLLARGNYDLIISDFHMDGDDGVLFLAEVLRQDPDTIRVLMTGYTDSEIERRARERAQVHAFVRKPWSSPDLLALVAGLIEERDTGARA